MSIRGQQYADDDDDTTLDTRFGLVFASNIHSLCSAMNRDDALFSIGVFF